MASEIKTLTIREMSRRSGVSTHALRFWEKELSGIIVPQRTKGGQRRYTPEHLLVVNEIKILKDKGMSLTEIRQALNQRYNQNQDDYNHKQADLLADKIAEMVRSAVFNYLESKTVKE
ncbi:MAG: MerR family transcriptional regulator [Deltaproteobacteria bacterium]|nr:MerR family transcriptional regulator [Deltaproteobacteria bacterium]